MPKLSELSRLIRSKNAGPFQQTLDIMFEVPEYFELVKAKGVITPQLVAQCYNLPVENISLTYYDAAYAIKISFPRPIAAGDIGNTDVFGAQQHAPLLDIEIPVKK
mgnify:CR=1 FL=1